MKDMLNVKFVLHGGDIAHNVRGVKSDYKAN